MSAMLEVRDLRVSYGKIEAVKGISFTVGQGEVVCLIGTNGAGKTTTLRTISGLIKPAGGQIHWFVNGVAFAGDYLSAASFLGICGMIAFYGYDGFLYSIGYLAGWIVAFAYALLAGFEIPTQRTLYMLSVVALALWSGRNIGASRTLLWALLVVLLVDPLSVLATGFWLSFGVPQAISMPDWNSCAFTPGRNIYAVACS